MSAYFGGSTPSVIALVWLSASVAVADPLVGSDGTPGAIVEWQTDGGTVILTVGEQYDASEVAQIIGRELENVQTRVDQNRVMVTGVKQDSLLGELAEMSVEPLVDDIDSMLQALQEGGNRQEGSGSSIRATKAMSTAELLGPPETRLSATVLAVQHGRFPLVLVTLRVDRASDKVEVSVDDKITVVPEVPMQNGRIVTDHPQSTLNVDAWYAQPGDKVEVRLSSRRRRVWMVSAYQRQRSKRP